MSKMSRNARNDWLQDLNSMLVSGVCHLVGLIALGLLSIVSQDGWSGVRLLVNNGDGLESTELDESALDGSKATSIPPVSASLYSTLWKVLAPSIDR